MRQFRVHIERSNVTMATKVYLVESLPSGMRAYSLAPNGFLVFKQVDPNAPVEPLLTLYDIEDAGIPILQALADGLAEAGIVAEVDNKQRITAQALADERQKEIEYLRGHVDAAVRKALQ